jgi:hypothetical protein
MSGRGSTLLGYARGWLPADSFVLRRIHTYHAVPMPFPYHAVLLRLYIVSFPFDLHSAAVFDSHMPCRSPAMPRICLSESDLSRPWQVRSMVAAAGRWHVDGMLATCQLMALAATTPSSRKFVIRSVPISDCSGQVASVKQSGVCDGREEAYYYFGART